MDRSGAREEDGARRTRDVREPEGDVPNREGKDNLVPVLVCELWWQYRSESLRSESYV